MPLERSLGLLIPPHAKPFPPRLSTGTSPCTIPASACSVSPNWRVSRRAPATWGASTRMRRRPWASIAQASVDSTFRQCLRGRGANGLGIGSNSGSCARKRTHGSCAHTGAVGRSGRRRRRRGDAGGARGPTRSVGHQSWGGAEPWPRWPGARGEAAAAGVGGRCRLAGPRSRPLAPDPRPSHQPAHRVGLLVEAHIHLAQQLLGASQCSGTPRRAQLRKRAARPPQPPLLLVQRVAHHTLARAQRGRRAGC